MLYIPRRHRRKLLLPPGLLALAFLLLVGCGILRNHPSLRRYSVFQFAMPVYGLCKQKDFFYNNELPPFCLSPIELERFRSWQTIEFTGNRMEDSLHFHQAVNSITTLKQDSSSERGIRFILGSEARYGSLVQIMDLLSSNIGTYWLDTRQQHTILYAYTKEKGPQATANKSARLPIISCGTGALMEADDKRMQQESRRLARREAVIANFTDFTNSRDGIKLLLFYSLAFTLILLSIRHIFYNLFSYSSVE